MILCARISLVGWDLYNHEAKLPTPYAVRKPF
jgi:hypothetical protein